MKAVIVFGIIVLSLLPHCYAKSTFPPITVLQSPIKNYDLGNPSTSPPPPPQNPPPPPPPSTIQYSIFSKVFLLSNTKSSYVLDNYNGAIAEGSTVGTYQQGGGSNQQWLYANVQNNCAMIQNVRAQMYLQCDTNGCRLSAQGTSFKVTTDGKFSSCDGTQYLTDGATMQSAITTDNSQVWSMIPVTIPFPSSVLISSLGLPALFSIGNAANPSNVLDDYYGSQSEGSLVNLYSKGNFSYNQKWIIANVNAGGSCAAFQNQYGNKNMYLKCTAAGCSLSQNPMLFAVSQDNHVSTCDGSQYVTIASDGNVKLQDLISPNSDSQRWQLS